jgi:hypothetical protein
MNRFKNWWTVHFDILLGWITASLGTLDLGTYIADARADITALVGSKAYAAVHIGIPLVAGSVIAVAGHLKKAREKALLPPPEKPPGSACASRDSSRRPLYRASTCGRL